MKKIWKAGKSKNCDDLVEWQYSISKMIWWSIGSSQGVQLFKQLIIQGLSLIIGKKLVNNK